MDIPLEAKEENGDEKPKKTRGRIKGGTVCDVCQKPMRSRYHLKVHLTVHTGEKNFICQICKKGFQQKWNLITHAARVHSKVKPFKCKDCGKAFGYSTHFKRHAKTHFLEKIEAPDAVKKRILNPYKCEFCDKSFDSHYRLDIHMKKHTGDKPFVCDKCGRSFTTKRLIVAHMAKKHDLEVDDFICQNCGKNFPDQSAMLLHLKTGHKICDMIGESVLQKKCPKPYTKKDVELIPCEVCGKTINRVTMNKHLNIHYRNRVYKCKYCSKEFLESGQRRIHERKHTGEKPYLCDVCGKGHSQYGNLLTHRKRYHNLTEKVPRLRKRITAPEPRTNFNLETEKIESMTPGEVVENVTEGNLEKSTKLPYTGDETIEEFMKKASNWIDEKFKESRPVKRKKTIKRSQKNEESDDDDDDDDDDEEDNLPLSRLRSEKIESKDENHCDEDTKDISDVENLGHDTHSEDSSQNTVIDLQDMNQDNILEEKEEKPQISDMTLETEEPESKVNELESDVDVIESKLNDSELDINDEDSKTSEPESTLSAKEVMRKMHDLIYAKIIQDLEANVEDDKLKEVLQVKITISENERDPLQQLLRLMKPIPDNCVTKYIEDKLFWHCWLCESKFRNRHLLTRHVIIHQPEKYRPYRCEICHKTFTQSNNYKEHVMSHKNENQYYCEKCGSGFRHKTHFNKHLRKHNPEMTEPRPRNFKCSHCEKRFSNSFHKSEHERKHTNERPYLCKTCGRQFGTSSTLHKHMRVHAAAIHQCNVCLKLFKHRYSLKRHLKTHSYNIEERFHCECGTSCGQKPSLRRHKLICKFNDNPVEKPFECLICLKRFGSSHDLKRHKATHETSKKYKCPICSTRIKTRETYKKHLKRHNNKPTEYEEFSCDDCNYTCVDVKDLTKHIADVHLSWKYE